MTTPTPAPEFEFAPEFLDALRYAAIAVVIGPDPDDPELFGGTVFAFAPPASRPRRKLAAPDLARVLRHAADELERDGIPL